MIGYISHPTHHRVYLNRKVMTMRKPFVLLVLAAVAFTALLVGPAAAQSNSDDNGVLVRVNGDVAVEAGAVHGVVVVVDGNLNFDGTATTVVVVNGDVVLNGAMIEELVVVSGTVNLGPETVVTGDVNLVDATLTQDPTATVEGTIDEDADTGLTEGLWVLGLIFMIGWAILVILGGFVLAGIAPDLARRAGRTITADLGPSILAGLVLWIVVPLIGALLFATFVGVPAAITIWVVVLPALGFVGFLVAGIRIGEYITSGGGGTGHPYLASFVGLLVLIIAGAIPAIGPLVVAIAGFLGSGALALHGYRALRNQHQPPLPPAPSEAPPAPTMTQT